MWGLSYGAITALRTAARRPAALRAIVPVMGMLDPAQDFVHPAGRGGLAALTHWSLVTLLSQLMPPLHRDADGRGSSAGNAGCTSRSRASWTYSGTARATRSGGIGWSTRRRSPPRRCASAAGGICSAPALSGLLLHPCAESPPHGSVDAHRPGRVAIRGGRLPGDRTALVGPLAAGRTDRGDGRAGGHAVPARPAAALARVRQLAAAGDRLAARHRRRPHADVGRVVAERSGDRPASARRHGRCAARAARPGDGRGLPDPGPARRRPAVGDRDQRAAAGRDRRRRAPGGDRPARPRRPAAGRPAHRRAPGRPVGADHHRGAVPRNRLRPAHAATAADRRAGRGRAPAPGRGRRRGLPAADAAGGAGAVRAAVGRGLECRASGRGAGSTCRPCRP